MSAESISRDFLFMHLERLGKSLHSFIIYSEADYWSAQIIREKIVIEISANTKFSCRST